MGWCSTSLQKWGLIICCILHKSNDETKHRSIRHNRSPDCLNDTQELDGRDSESTFSCAQGMINYTVCGARELNCMGKVCVAPNNSLQKVSVIMVLATKLSRSLATKNRKFPRNVFTRGNLSRNINGHVPNKESTSHRPNLFKVISPLSFFFFFLEGLFLLKRNEFP